MKSIALATAIVVLTAGVASAEHGYRYNHYNHYKHFGKQRTVGHLSFFERVRIARSRNHLARLKHHVLADRHVTRHEFSTVSKAVRRHREMVRRDRRD